MINKSLVKRRFKKSLATYEENAHIQKEMAEKLIKMLPSKNYDSILEIGSSTGILTKNIKKNLKFKHYTAIDIVGESRKYIEKIIPDADFLEGDIEEIELNETYDLIISNACLQWCINPSAVVKKLQKKLNQCAIMAVTLFGEENLKELKSYFNIKMQAPIEFENIISQETETIKLYFNSPKDILKHIKYTGANALTEYKLTRTKLSEFEQYYKEHYSEDSKVYITYNPRYLILN